MSNLAISLVPETLRSLAFGSISGTYAAIGTALANPSRILIIQNFTNDQLIYSFDGTNNHLTLPSGGQIVLDFTANKTVTGGAAYVAAGTTIYVKQVAGPSSGSTYVSTFYGING
jgi:hypothetical protein